MKRTFPLIVLMGAAACEGGGGGTTTPEPRVTSLAVLPSEAFVSVGDTARLRARVSVSAGGDTADVEIRWRSLGTGVATVDAGGLLRGVTEGETRVVAEAGALADTVGVTVLGASARAFNVTTVNCSSPEMAPSRRVATSAHFEVWEDMRNPSPRPSVADYEQVLLRAEELVYPVNTQNFGQPSDLDGNGKAIILYTRAVNELTGPNSGSYVGGFFHPRDLFPREDEDRFDGCPTSNLAEMFYMLAVDENGEVNNNRRAKTFVLDRTVATVAHEYQHLINSSRRLRTNNANGFEEVWLDEGLAHIAEELVFYAASGRAPRQNLTGPSLAASATQTDAFLRYSEQNFSRLWSYLEATPDQSPFYVPGSDDGDVETRGAIWSFLRYAADRRGGNEQPLWFGLVNATNSGMANLQARLGTDPMPLFRDWAVATYVDDQAAGLPARFTMPSWNHRSVYGTFYTGDPLNAVRMTNGVPSNVTLGGGGVAFLRLAVAPGQVGDVRVSATGTAGAGDCTAVNLAVGQAHQVDAAGAQAMCLAGGAQTAEYAIVLFNASAASSSTAPVTVVGSGIITPAEPLAAPTLSRVAEQVVRGAALRPDRAWEQRWRARTHRELASMLRGGARASHAVAADPAAPTVQVSVVRVR